MLHTVYDKTGKSATLESVDAREYVATGNWSYTDPTGKAKAKLAVESANKLAAEALKAEAEAELAQAESIVAQATIVAEETAAKAAASNHPDDKTAADEANAALADAKEALDAIKLKQSGDAPPAPSVVTDQYTDMPRDAMVTVLKSQKVPFDGRSNDDKLRELCRALPKE